MAAANLCDSWTHRFATLENVDGEGSFTQVVADVEAVDRGPLGERVGLRQRLPGVVGAADDEVPGHGGGRHGEDHRSAEEERRP
jgi:hypothetical protein